MQARIDYGKGFQHTLRLTVARFGTFMAVLMLLVMRLGPAPVSAGPSPADCSTDCIATTTVAPHGTFANFHIVLTGTAKVILEAYVTGKPGTTASATFSLGGDVDWHTTLMNLNPNTAYTYTVKATDAQGHVHEDSGLFKTLHRQVTVTFKDIHVIDD